MIHNTHHNSSKNTINKSSTTRSLFWNPFQRSYNL